MKTMFRLGLVATLAHLLACASVPEPKKEVSWPPPPDKPRVRFVTAFNRETSFKRSSFENLWRYITGAEDSLVLNQPTGLALSPDERRLYAATTLSGVLVFDFDEKTVRPVGTSPEHPVGMPFGVAVDADENVYVSATREGVVRVYDKNDGFLLELGRNLLERPTGVAVDRKNRLLYVVDSGEKRSDRHCVEVFSLDGRHLRTIGKKGAGDGEFFFPAYATVSADGELYVGDVLNSRVQIFDKDGNFKGKFGQSGGGYGGFTKIKGLAFDAFGNLHVADGGTGIIQIFRRDLQPLMYYGGRANLVEYFDMPTDLVIDSKNQIYVGNFFLSRINKYEIFNTTVDDLYAPPAAEPTTPPAGEPAPAEDPSDPASPAAPPSEAAPPTAAPAQAPPGAPTQEPTPGKTP